MNMFYSPVIARDNHLRGGGVNCISQRAQRTKGIVPENLLHCARLQKRMIGRAKHGNIDSRLGEFQRQSRRKRPRPRACEQNRRRRLNELGGGLLTILRHGPRARLQNLPRRRTQYSR